ncbi:MAG: hypothetical protein ACI91V_000903, partial [Lentimonas sp.]
QHSFVARSFSKRSNNLTERHQTLAKAARYESLQDTGCLAYIYAKDRNPSFFVRRNPSNPYG